jgi:HEAT repeat protein
MTSRLSIWGCLFAALVLAGCGQARTEGELVEGKPHGPWKYWYATGQREKAGSYKNGIEDGLWTYWYENGQRAKSGSFAEGKEQGDWVQWYENGQKKEQGTYDHGLQHGAWVYWHDNGQRSEERTFADGAQVGAPRHWNLKGVPDIDASTNSNISSLIALLRDRNPSVSAGAMPALERLGAVAIPALVDLLRDDSPHVRHNALRVLLKIGPKLESEAARLTPALIDCLGDPDPRISPLAMQSLVLIGPRTVPELAGALANGRAAARNWAAMALGEFKENAKDAVKPLVAALYDPNTRQAAGDALSAIGAPAVLDLKTVLEDDTASGQVRIMAIKSLSKVGAAAAPAVPPLVDLLADRDALVRKEAVNCLGMIGEPSVKSLVAAIKDVDKADTFRDTATTALGKVGAPAVPALVPELKHEDREVRFRAAVALGDIGRAAKDALPAVEAARASETDDNVKRYLDNAITKINRSK